MQDEVIGNSTGERTGVTGEFRDRAENTGGAHFVYRAVVTGTAVVRRAVEPSINTRSQSRAWVRALRRAGTPGKRNECRDCPGRAHAEYSSKIVCSANRGRPVIVPVRVSKQPTRRVQSRTLKFRDNLKHRRCVKQRRGEKREHSEVTAEHRKTPNVKSR